MRIGRFATELLKEPVKAAKALADSAPNIQQLTSDVVNLAKTRFSKLEQEIMENIRPLAIENAHVIDENGQHVKDLKFIGDEMGVRLDPEMILQPELSGKLRNSIYIHNHAVEAPLSANDILTMTLNEIKKNDSNHSKWRIFIL